MPPGSTQEPVVRRSTPMPKGYVFVPKGNVYITGNCRKQTQADGRTVYAVIDKNKRIVGIRVPSSVYTAVVASEASTRQDRASAVQKRDETLERQFREAVKKMFPKAPEEDVPRVVARAMKKGSGRVGRTSKIDVEQKARLAVAAHIRHCHTSYDRLLRQGFKRDKARAETIKKVGEVLQSWGGSMALKGAKHVKSAKKSTMIGKPIESAKKSKNARKTGSKNGDTLARRTNSQAQTPRSGRRLVTSSGSSLSPPSPKERRMNKLKTRRDIRNSTVSAAIIPANSKIGRSLGNELSDVSESDTYCETSDSYAWSGTDDEDFD